MTLSERLEQRKRQSMSLSERLAERKGQSTFTQDEIADISAGIGQEQARAAVASNSDVYGIPSTRPEARLEDVDFERHMQPVFPTTPGPMDHASRATQPPARQDLGARAHRGFGGNYVPPEERGTLAEDLRAGTIMGIEGVKSGWHGTRAMFESDPHDRQKHLDRFQASHDRIAENPLSVPEFTGIRSPRDFGRWALGQSGALAPILGSIMAGGATVGKAGAAIGSVGGPKGTVIGGTIGSVTGSFNVGYMLYAGGLYGDLRKEGAEHDESKRAALVYGAPASLVSIAVPAAATSSVMGYLGRDYLRRNAMNMVMGAGLGATTEGLAEAFAESFVIMGEMSVLGRVYSDEEIRNRIVNAGAAGTLMGLGTGTAGAGGRPSGDINTILDGVIDQFEQAAQDIDKGAMYDFIIESLESAGSITPEHQALLEYLKTEQGNNRQINRGANEAQKIALEVAKRPEEQNVARQRELWKKKADGSLTSREAIELTALNTNSPAAQAETISGLQSNQLQLTQEDIEVWLNEAEQAAVETAWDDVDAGDLAGFQTAQDGSMLDLTARPSVSVDGQPIWDRA